MIRVKLFGYSITIKHESEHVRKSDFASSKYAPKIDNGAAVALSNEIVTDDLIQRARAMRTASALPTMQA